MLGWGIQVRGRTNGRKGSLACQTHGWWAAFGLLVASLTCLARVCEMEPGYDKGVGSGAVGVGKKRAA